MSSEIDYRRIGRHFRAARQQLNLKQKDVAELLGVSVKTYSNMERGAQELSLYRIIQLCQLLKLKPGCAWMTVMMICSHWKRFLKRFVKPRHS